MELVASKELWLSASKLACSFRGLLAMAVMFLVSSFVGYRIHALFHGCKNSTHDIRNQYERWHRNVVVTNKEILRLTLRLKRVAQLFTFSIVPILFLIASLLYSKVAREYVFGIRGAMILVLAAVAGYMGMLYRRYVNYRLQKLQVHKAKFEAEKDTKINDVLGDLSPSMQVDLREKLKLESQTTLEKQAVQLKRLQKEKDMYEHQLQRQRDIAKEIEGFKWCNECMRGSTQNIAPVGGERKPGKERLFFQCPQHCLRLYFGHCKKIYEEFGNKDADVRLHAEEAKKLKEEEQMLEAAKERAQAEDKKE